MAINVKCPVKGDRGIVSPNCQHVRQKYRQWLLFQPFSTIILTFSIVSICIDVQAVTEYSLSRLLISAYLLWKNRIFASSVYFDYKRKYQYDMYRYIIENR